MGEGEKSEEGANALGVKDVELGEAALSVTADDSEAVGAVACTGFKAAYRAIATMASDTNQWMIEFL